MLNDTGKHCVFYHRYHLVWTTKYRYKILTAALRLRDTCRQICAENGVDILREVLERSCASVRVGAAEAYHLRSDAHDDEGGRLLRYSGSFPRSASATVDRDDPVTNVLSLES